MHISDWSSDVCSSDLLGRRHATAKAAMSRMVRKDHRGRMTDLDAQALEGEPHRLRPDMAIDDMAVDGEDHHASHTTRPGVRRSEEHTSELQSLMRISYAVFCLKKKKKHKILHL